MTSSSFYDVVLDELRRRKVAFVEQFIPYYLFSFGTHLFNLFNAKARIYHAHGAVPDFRLHIMFVAPPGFSKSFFIKHLLHPDHGCLSNAGVPTSFEDYMTQSGFTGTFDRDSKGNIVERKGMLEEMAEGVVGMEEFSALTAAMKQQHSLGLDSAVLEALDSGIVRKRMGVGTKNVTTYVTLWAGTQSTRFELTSGLGRRFFYLVWVPTKDERNKLKDAVHEGRNVELDPANLAFVRSKIRALQEKVNKIRSVEICKDIDAFLKPRVHYEEILLERMAVGYTIARENFDTHLQVSLDPVLKILMTRALQWRDRLLSESEGDQIIQVLKDHGNSMLWPELKQELLVFGLDYSSSEGIIQKLISTRQIEYKKGKLWVQGTFIDTREG
jgi:hypothetical protein